MNLVKKWLFVSVLLLVAMPGQATQDYQFHSYFFLNFAKYTQWPSEYSSGDFVIGVLGDSKVKDPLNQLARERQIRSRKIVIKSFNATTDVDWCHILFVPFEKSNELPAVLEAVAGKPIMVVTEKPGLGRQGSTMNFVLVNGRWNFEYNRTAAENANLKVASELTSLAIII